jgi:hypothetical protein
MKSGCSEIIERLAKGKIRFVIIGGFAGIVHGCTYVTQDIDICCDFSADNLMALQEVLKDLHPVNRMTPRRLKLKLTAENCADFKNLYLDTDIGQLDCLGYVQGLGNYQNIEPLSELREIEGGQRIRVLTIDSLIKSKKAMNRPRDRKVLLELEAIEKMRKKHGKN